MAQYKKRELGDALLQAFAPLTVKGGGYVRVLEWTAGAAPVEEMLSRALQVPAVFVSFSSSSYSPGPYLHATETLVFNVSVVARRGGPYAFDVLEDARGVLAGNTLGLDVTPLRLLRETALTGAGELDAVVATYSLSQKVVLPAQAQST